MLILFLRQAWVAFLKFFIPPPIVPPPPRANLLDPCPICGATEKASVKCVGTPQFVGLQFMCSTCAARWYKPPVRAKTSVNEVWPAEILEAPIKIQTVEV